MRSKLGPAAATTATAHKIAVVFYAMVKNQREYDETIWARRDAQREQRFEAKVAKSDSADDMIAALDGVIRELSKMP